MDKLAKYFSVLSFFMRYSFALFLVLFICHGL